MANALFDKGREGFLDGSIDWDTNKIQVVAVDSAGYTPNLGSDTFLSVVPAIDRIATSAFLTAKTVPAGVADAADILYSGLTGDSIELLVFVRAAALDGDANLADTAQRLILLIDTAPGLPFTPSGADLSVAWDSGANRIFKL